MTEAWLTAAELAGLPGMPESEFRTRAQLKSMGVPSRARAGRGGGREFDCAALPAETQRALFLLRIEPPAAAAPAAVPAPAQAAQVPAVRKPHEPSRQEAACADARLVLLRQLHTMAELEPGGLKAACERLATRLSAAELEPELLAQAALANRRTRRGAAEADEGVPISARTLLRWHADHKARGWEALLPTPPKSTALAALPEDVTMVLAAYANASGAARNLTHCAQRINTELGRPFDEWHTLYRRAHRALPKVPKIDLIKARHTGAERAAKLPFKRRKTSDIAPLDVCLVDGHTFKAKVRHPDHGAPFAPEVTALIDAATRKICGWSVALSENTIAVGDALRHAAATHGIWAIYYSDNGAGERAKVFDCDTVGVFARIGAEHRTGIAGHPQGHGLIERSWQTHMLRCARQFGSYQGKDVDARTLRNVRLELDKEQRAVRRASATGEVVKLSTKCPSWQQFIDAVGKAFETYNAHHRHRGLPKHASGPHAGRHMTPDEAWELMLQPGDQVRLDGPQLRHLFMPAQLCTARRGEVQLFNQRYYNRELMQVDGQKVRIHYDIHDPARVWAWTIEGAFITECALDGNAMPYMPKSVVQMAREKRVAGMVKRRNLQIDQALRELQPTLPMGEPAMLPAAPASAPLPLVQRLEERDPVPAETARRPFFDAASDRYEWLMQHRAQCTPDEAAWLAAYAASDDYEALRGYFESRGLAWQTPGAPPAFNEAG